MEHLFRTSNTNPFADPTHRMPKRPCAVKSGQGIGFQELGSSFAPSKPVPVRKTYKSKSKPPFEPRKPSPPPDNASDDEILLCSSQPSVKDDTVPSSKRVVKAKKQSLYSDEEEKVHVNGRLLTAHPDYRPSSFDALKKLRFKKNTENTDSIAEEAPPPSSSLDLSQELFKPISDDVEIVEATLDSPPWRTGGSSTRPKSPSTTRTGARPFSDTKDPKPTAPMRDISRPISKPSRPKPRVVITRKRDIDQDTTPRAGTKGRGYPLRSKAPEKPENERAVKKPLSSTSRREPQEFPMSLQAKENVSDGACSGDGASNKTKKAVIPRSATFAYTPKPIPLPSPLKTKPVSRTTTFPNLSPLSSSLDKGKGRAKDPDEVDTDSAECQRKHRGPQPFPMSPLMLAGIDRRSTSPSSHSLKSAKRVSSDDSEAEQGRTAKKYKDSRARLPDRFDEDDSFDMDRPRDPSKMCPYCDEDLPPDPTPSLRDLLATARKKSVSDPRPRNRGGLRAPLTVYISVCQRHRFETHQLPIAIKRGWPNTIDFDQVPARIKKMKKDLQAIILDKDDFSDVEDLDGHTGARSKSIFWREVKKEVKKQGSRTVVGVKGQFASFEKTQPGYYGEQGSVIIHQTLFNLFPPSTFDASLIVPLAPAEFIQRVLVPEVAVRLIAEDLSVSMDDALVTLRDSSQYGVAMFPDTAETKSKGRGGGSGDCDDDDDEMGVADRIVMERARIRRKEIAEEEAVEEKMLEEARAAQRAKARESRRREKAVQQRVQPAKRLEARAGSVVDTGALSEASETGDVCRTRRATRQHAVVNDAAESSDAMSVDGPAVKRAPRVTTRGTARIVKGIDPSDASDSGSIEIVDDFTSKANVGRSKTKGRVVEPDDRTPRPNRQRKMDASATHGPANALLASALPLQMARNKTGTRALASRDGWSRSLLPNAADDSDSDASNASRRSQRLVCPSIKESEIRSWLFGSQSSQDS